MTILGLSGKRLQPTIIYVVITVLCWLDQQQLLSENPIHQIINLKLELKLATH